MPKALHVCGHPGCAMLTASSYCAAHVPDRQPWPEQLRPSPARRGYDRQWQLVRRQYLRLSPQCVACGGEATEVDHIVALRDGGTHDDDNLQALCRPCHSSKTLASQNRR